MHIPKSLALCPYAGASALSSYGRCRPQYVSNGFPTNELGDIIQIRQSPALRIQPFPIPPSSNPQPSLEFVMGQMGVLCGEFYE